MAEDEAVTTLKAGLSSNVDEPQAVPGGEEYEIKLISVEVRTQKPEKGDGKFVRASIRIIGVKGASLLGHTMMLPDGKDEDNDEFRNLTLQRFYDGFSISHEDGEDIDLTEGLGNTTRVILNAKESEGYGLQNNIVRYLNIE